MTYRTVRVPARKFEEIPNSVRNTSGYLQTRELPSPVLSIDLYPGERIISVYPITNEGPVLLEVLIGLGM